MATVKIVNMSDLAQIIDDLPPVLKAKAEGYVEGLHQLMATERQRFLSVLEEADDHSTAGRVLDDANFKAKLEEEFGPLDH